MVKIFLILLMSISAWAGIGNIMALRGAAEVERTQGDVAAKSGMELLEGDKIVTKEKSRVQVMLKDETIVTIGANSSFSFDEYSFDGTKDSKALMHANRGFFRSVTGKLSKIAPERFKVKTASATIGIRGTDFSGDISAKKELIKCYKGRIFVEFQGRIQDIDAGSFAEIMANKIEVKKILSQSMNKIPASLKKQIKAQIQNQQLSVEEVNDIIESAENLLNSEGGLSVTPGTEDREQQY